MVTVEVDLACVESRLLAGEIEGAPAEDPTIPAKVYDIGVARFLYDG